MQTPAPLPYAGHYINLDRSPERRAWIEAELQRHNLVHAYARFSAADGNTLGLHAPGLIPGVIGCWISNVLLLKENLDTGKHLHIIEDDASFAPCAKQVIRWAIDAGHLDACDILYTDVSVPLRNDVYKSYKAFYDRAVEYDAAGNIANIKFQIVDLSKITWASTNSFLVNKNSARKLHDLLDAEMRRGPQMPIDLFLREKNHEGALRIGCIFPFVTTPRLESGLLSSIDPQDERRLKIAAAIGRYALFAGCDRDLCRQWIEQYAALPQPEDWLTPVLGRLLTHSITDAYRFF